MPAPSYARRAPRSVRAGRAVMLLSLVGATIACEPTTDPPGLHPADPGAADVRFTADVNVGGHTISALIYGTNDGATIATDRFTVLRSGGNRLTAYNWENNASNAGSDWCFQNDGFMSSSNTPAAAITPMINTAKANGAAAIVTVPIVDHVAADKNGGCDVRNSGPDYLSTRFQQNKHTKPGGVFTTSPNTTDDFVYEDEYVNLLKTTQSDANIIFSLDNEPDLWSATHEEIHPTAVTYSELLQRNIDYAKAIKRVWPTATVAGPVNYGFYGMEALQGAPDAAANGNFLNYYLTRMKNAETANGKRLVDYLDVHWYPEATGGGSRITNGGTSAAEVAARVQAPRSLWDPTYSEASWITTDYGYGPIRLLGRMKERINTYYPGTHMAFTEWNYGAGSHISGAVASADVLGIFGREDVKLATMWPLASETYTNAAFRAFRNYNGAGATFGNVSFSSPSSDNAVGSAYASLDSANPDRVVMVVINKATTARTAAVTVAHPTTFARIKPYTLTAAGGPNLVGQSEVSAVGTNAFRYTMPAMSVSVLELRT